MTEFLNQEVIEELLQLKPDGILYKRESQQLEFKESFNLAGLADYFKDFAAFANNKGGYLIFGIRDRPRRERVGLSENSRNQFENLDPERIAGFLLDCFDGTIYWEQEVFEIEGTHFAAFYIHEAENKPIICKKDEGRDQVLKNGEIYFRYGGRTQKIQAHDLSFIINQRIDGVNKMWIERVTQIGSVGPQNAFVVDTTRRVIKNKNKTLVIDQELAKDFNWIKEGEFKERGGAKALKLVGSVQAIDAVEIEKEVLKESIERYTLSYAKIWKEAKKVRPNIKQPEFNEIIKENDIKNKAQYSGYVFDDIEKKKNYEKTGKLPKNIKSNYCPEVIDLIVKLYDNRD